MNTESCWLQTKEKARVSWSTLEDLVGDQWRAGILGQSVAAPLGRPGDQIVLPVRAGIQVSRSLTHL